MSSQPLRLRCFFVVFSILLLLGVFFYFGFWLKFLSAALLSIIISGVIFFSQFKSKIPAVKKTPALLIILVFNILFIVCLRSSVFSVYHIPTNSMENALVPGDVVLVDTHISRDTNSSSFENQVLSRNDIIVFHSASNIPLVKRCVGLAGDVITIKKSEVYINNRLFDESNQVMHKYLIKLSNPIEFKKSLALDNAVNYEDLKRISQYDFEANLTKEAAENIAYFNGVVKVSVLLDAVNTEDSLFFKDIHSSWSPDHMGPIKIPEKGMTIQLNQANYLIYHKLIETYEKAIVIKRGDKFFTNAKEINSYTFKKDYCFLLGDNRSSSRDSRFIGCIPEGQIIGKVKLVLYSTKEDYFDWSRYLKII